MITMTRRAAFSAGKIDSRTDVDTTGEHDAACESAEPYGHNYVLDVSVAGEIDPRTGIIVNIKEIDSIVRERIVERFDGKMIHRQAPEFSRRAVTAETLAVWIANALQDSLPKEVVLTAVRLEETPLIAAEWRSRQPMKSLEDNRAERLEMRTTRVYEFAASHRLHSPHLSDDENRDLFGKCNYPNGHGHNYILEVTVAGPLDDLSGRVMRHEDLDKIVHQEVVDRYDHRHLNYDIPEFEDLVPSTEVVTRMIWQRLVGEIPAPARLVSVLVRETARNIFEYRGEA
jgi:6-pyruvoyltetrahydropterin/6-carboxytetrahydropterin synthase